jgi:hypothetical protein
MNVYKSGITDTNTRVIITLFIPINAKTNLDRLHVVDPTYAKYRSNIARVLCIEDDHGNTHSSAHTAFHNKKIQYNLNEYIKSEYDTNINIVCGKGIHFFIDRQMAYNYNRKILEQKWDTPNLYKTYYDNGQLKEIIEYIHDQTYGYIKQYIYKWFKNGVKYLIQSYQQGLKNGVFTEWHENGKLKYECNFINDSKDGLERIHYYNGQRKLYISYSNGTMNGKCNSWHMNGKIDIECNFYRGILCNNFKKWGKNGDLVLFQKYFNIPIKPIDKIDDSTKLINEINDVIILIAAIEKLKDD